MVCCSRWVRARNRGQCILDNKKDLWPRFLIAKRPTPGIFHHGHVETHAEQRELHRLRHRQILPRAHMTSCPSCIVCYYGVPLKMASILASRGSSPLMTTLHGSSVGGLYWPVSEISPDSLQPLVSDLRIRWSLANSYRMAGQNMA